ncbi:MAG: hypothetical protein WA705_11580 [Candidatus Ozemobacteraceae bacterium]
MDSSVGRPRRAMSVIEVLVGAVIMVIISGGMYKILSASRFTAAIATARSQAREMADVCLRSLEKDISSSQATVKTAGSTTTTKPVVVLSFQPQGTNSWTMLIPEGNSFKKVTYSFDGSNKLERDDASGSKRLLCDKVVAFSISDMNTVAGLPQEQVSIEIKVGIAPEGVKEPQVHHQKLLVTIRAATQANLDPRWRNTNDVINNY